MYFIAKVHMYFYVVHVFLYVKERFVMFSYLTTYTSSKVKILQISCESDRQISCGTM